MSFNPHDGVFSPSLSLPVFDHYKSTLEYMTKAVETRISELNKIFMMYGNQILEMEGMRTNDLAGEYIKNTCNRWWEVIVDQFFDGSFQISGPFYGFFRKFILPKPILPRYFRLLFDSGILHLEFFTLGDRTCRFRGNQFFVDYNVATMQSEYRTIPLVVTNGSLKIGMDVISGKITSWHFEHRASMEFATKYLNGPRSCYKFTENGILPNVMNFLEISTTVALMKPLFAKYKETREPPTVILQDYINLMQNVSSRSNFDQKSCEGLLKAAKIRRSRNKCKKQRSTCKK